MTPDEEEIEMRITHIRWSIAAAVLPLVFSAVMLTASVGSGSDQAARVPALIKVLEDQDQNVRRSAARALGPDWPDCSASFEQGVTGSRRGRPQVGRLCSDADWPSRQRGRARSQRRVAG